MLYRTCLGLVITSAVIFASAIPSNYAAQNSENAQSEKIKSLLKERRDVLEKRVNAFESQHKSGISNLESVIDARDDFFVAELELAETSENRVELLESRVKNLKLGEQRILELQKTGSPGGSETDALLATSRRLLAEIELARALAAD